MACSKCGFVEENCRCKFTDISCPTPETCSEIYPVGCVEYTSNGIIQCASDANTLYPNVDHTIVSSGDTTERRRLDAILQNINDQFCYIFSVPFITQLLTNIANNQTLSALFCQLACNCQCNNVCNSPTNLTVGTEKPSSVFASLSWIPGGGTNSTGQIVKYKLHSASTWTSIVMSGPLVNSYAISGLTSNVKYDFLVENVCSSGNTVTDSFIAEGMYIDCPAPVFTVTSTTILVSISSGSTDATSYQIDVIDSSGVTVQTWTTTIIVPVISHTFIGLNTGATYSVAITVRVQDNILNLSRSCLFTNVTTTAGSCTPLGTQGISANTST